MSRTAIGLLVVCSLVLFSSLGATTATAVTRTLTLDPATIPATVTACGISWVEAAVSMSFVSTTVDDCAPGNCFFGIGTLDPGGVDLFPARLRVSLLSIDGDILSAEVDVIDYCGVGCTQAFFYNGGALVDAAGNTVVSQPETLAISTGGSAADVLAVSSCEGACVEIRIEYRVPVPVEITTWGAIKALFDN